MTATHRRRLLALFRALLRAHGPQHWWPGETPFEVMVGAVLTQNTAWSNVERAIANLSDAGCLEARAIVTAPPRRLARWLEPSGYYNVKARRLRNLCTWYLEQGGHRALALRDTATLRRGLLSVNGVGPETADDMLLYAFGRPVFVIDAYTRRLFSRLGLVRGDEDYEEMRRLFEESLDPDPDLFGEYHALIVRHGKEVCRRRPRCSSCTLARRCPTAAPED